VAAATLERWDVAVDHFRQAMAADEALGHRPAHVLSDAGLGEALAVTGEAAESVRCIARAQAAATALGMDAWCARWRQSAAPAHHRATAADRRGRIRVRSDPRRSRTLRTGLAPGRARTRDRARRALPRLPHRRRTCALLGPESDPACPGPHRDSRP